MGVALVHYDTMRRELDAAEAIDEVKDLRDRAIALEAYAKQANDREAERKILAIRLRAERKVGQLLAETEKAKGAAERGTNRGATPSHRASASLPLKNLGISHTQSSRWQKLAAVPEDEFERTLAEPAVKPSTTRIIEDHKAKSAPATPKQEPIDSGALWLWGRLLDFERDGLLERHPETICATMLPHMKDAVRELAPKVAQWLERVAP